MLPVRVGSLILFHAFGLREKVQRGIIFDIDESEQTVCIFWDREGSVKGPVHWVTNAISRCSWTVEVY